ncbi:class I SAM-dependent methyltransferase [Nonomuraea sp. NPDC047897]|uniref:class I SAM-dependent methyltransferase n=1 Tax=Nonomuraea sp. NPDC047897 TaxID=3364346 RepID=UPI00371A1FB8
MPTPLADEPQRELRRVAESFGADAEHYDRTRPRYPDAMIRRIAAAPGRHVLDVGCGTGIAARQFQAAGCQVLGVDPDARINLHAAVRTVVNATLEARNVELWGPGTSCVRLPQVRIVVGEHDD